MVLTTKPLGHGKFQFVSMCSLLIMISYGSKSDVGKAVVKATI
jgi:hypothetical protein